MLGNENYASDSFSFLASTSSESPSSLTFDSFFISECASEDVQHLAKKQLSEDQIIILKAYHDLNLLNIIDNEVRIYEEVRKLDFLYWVESKLNDLGFLFQENLLMQVLMRWVIWSQVELLVKSV